MGVPRVEIAVQLGGIESLGVADVAQGHIQTSVPNLIGFYVARAFVGFDDLRNAARMLDAFLTRCAVVRGLEIPRRP